MRFLMSKRFVVVGLLTLLLVSGSACGDSASTLVNPAGDWLIVSVENVTEGVRTDCPGTSGELECGTATFNLAESGTLTILETTDETGAPSQERIEGIWLTEGSTLTITLRLVGEDAESLEPIDPPEITTGLYAVTGDTLTWTIEEDGNTFLSTYTRR